MKILGILIMALAPVIFIGSLEGFRSPFTLMMGFLSVGSILSFYIAATVNITAAEQEKIFLEEILLDEM